MLVSSIKETIKNLLPAGFEGDDKSISYTALIITIIVWILLVLLVSKYLWNEVLVKLVTVVNPSTSMFQMLGLMFLIQILYPK